MAEQGSTAPRVPLPRTHGNDDSSPDDRPSAAHRPAGAQTGDLGASGTVGQPPDVGRDSNVDAPRFQAGPDTPTSAEEG